MIISFYFLLNFHFKCYTGHMLTTTKLLDTPQLFIELLMKTHR